MLSPSSPAQKNLCDEDSSGSDAGSEAGLEPETDRFGFIVTNGSTAGSVGPPPELVRQREAKWINIIVQWDRILLKKTSKVKVQCQKGIPASLRAKCWPLLCGATDRMKQNENLYQSLDSQPALQSWVDVIERDLDRQFPFHEMFLSKDGHGQRGLFRVLKAYTQYQPEEGYCQAQGPVAAVLLMNMPAEEAFWCLVQISEQYLPGYYSPLLEGVLFDAAMLTWVLKRTCPAAHKHLQHHGVEPLMFATDWLMCLFTRHLPFNTLLRVWDLFFCYGVRVLLQVAVVLVRRVLGRAEQRKQCQGQMETLERLRGVREQVQEEDDSFIAEVCSVPLSARDLDKQTEKQLAKWRKDRPSSTFDPRGRCYGYRMAWARARQNEEERNRKEREKGNLSVPLARSASTLSLSPSILHKWRKGGKVNAGEWEGGGRVVRHLSMGAKEDWSSWADVRFKKVQGVQEEEDTVSEEHEEQSKPKQTGESEQKEPTKMDTIQNIPTEHVEETVLVKEQVETRITEKEESQLKETETEESKMLSEQTEETNVEIEPNQGPAKDQTVENILQQGEELGSSSPSQVLEQQSHKSKDQDIEVKDKNKETEIQEAESEPTAAVEKNQTETQKDAEADTNTEVETEESVDPSEEQMIQADMKPEESLEIENVQQTQVDTVTEVSETVTETSPISQTDEAITETQEQQQEAITETQEPQQEAITETQEQQQEAITETQEQQQEAITETQEQQQEAITETQEQQQEAITETQEQQQEAITETQEQQQEAITETQEQQQEAITETQEQQQEAITETDNSLQGDVFEQKYHSTESLSETELKEEPHTQTETETDVLAQNQKQVEKNVGTSDELDGEIVQIDSEQHIDSIVEAEAIKLCSPEYVQPQEGADSKLVDTESEAEIPVSNDTVTQSSEALAQCSEKVVNAAASEPTEEEGEILTAHSGGDNDETQAEETPTETQTKEETMDSTEPSAQAEAVSPTAEPDGETSSVEVSASETAPEPPKIQGTMGGVEEKESPGDVQEDTVGENDVFISTEPTDSNTDSNAHVQDTESHCPKDQTEPNNSGLTQASRRRNSRSSGDFCVRKSSSSRGSRLGRRLSEDLFTVPQKTSQSESIPNQPEVKRTESQSSPGAVNPTQTPPDVTSEVTSSLPAGAAERTEAQQEQKPPDPPKRFGLFRRLRGDQPKKAKAKGAAKMQVPKILIQDFSDGTGMEKPVEEEEEEEEEEEKLSSRERRRRRREQERREKEEERLRKKKEKELEKEKGRERRKPQTRGKSFQVQREKGSSDEPAKTASQKLKNVSYAESYF